MTTKEIAYEVVNMLDSKKGQKLRLLKIDRVSSLADYFIICTGTSNTHVRTLCDIAEDTLEKLGENKLVVRVIEAILGSFWTTVHW